jgi:hypothetical protein
MMKSIKSFDDFLYLNEIFKNVRFYEKDHKYKINGNLSKYSVTSLLKKYTQEFESDKIAKNVAFKQNKKVEDVLKEWDYKKNYSCFKGTSFHLYVENFLNRKFSSIDEKSLEIFLLSEDCKNINEKKQTYIKTFKQMIISFLNFYKWYDENYYFMKSEFVVGDDESGICGTIDNLSYHKKEKTLAILDYKTNQNIKNEGFKGQKMLHDLSHLDDCELVKYSLQLHIYKYILEKKTGFIVNNLHIVWFPENGDYRLISPLCLQEEAEMLLNKEIIIYENVSS